jgi:hypothetical protein
MLPFSELNNWSILKEDFFLAIITNLLDLIGAHQKQCSILFLYLYLEVDKLRCQEGTYYLLLGLPKATEE